MKKQVLTVVLAISSFGLANAQRISVTSGNLAPLAGQSEINVEYTYDHMKVGEFDKEEDYIAKKREEYNKKEAGRGDNWAKAWVADRENRFEPKFNELFHDASGITAGGSPKSKYTMIVHTVFTEPGFNVGIVRKNAKIDLVIDIVETANREKKVASLTVDKALGRTFGGFDFDTGLRISEAYADAGKALGKYIRKEIK